MSEEDSAAFAMHVEAGLEVVRDALARIEEAAQKDDEQHWLDASRRFAGLIAPMREYLNGLQMGRDLPQNLGRRLEPLLAELEGLSDEARKIGLDEHLAALRGLVHEAHARS